MERMEVTKWVHFESYYGLKSGKKNIRGAKAFRHGMEFRLR